MATHANKFVEDFYFQHTANKTSKALQDALNKEEKAKTRQPGREPKFALTEESVRDVVKAEVQRLSSQKGFQNSSGRSKRKDNAASNGVNKSQRKPDPYPKVKTIASVAKAQGETSSSVADRQTTTDGSHCQKTAPAELPATERRPPICIRKMAVLHG